jgi:secreted PhoX family phosphatase
MPFSDSPTLQTLLARRLNRRRLLEGGVELAALGVVAQSAYGQTGEPSGLSFPRVQPSKADAVIVPDGYRTTS